MLATALVLLALPVAQPQPPQLDVATSATGVVLEVSGREAGPVEVWDGGRLVAVLPAGSGPTTFATNVPGEHAFVAVGSGDPALIGGPGAAGVTPASGAADAGRWGTAGGADVTAGVVVPVGSLTVSVQRTPDGRTSVATVTDTRAGEPGFTVAAAVPERTRLSRVWAEQVPGNALDASSLGLTHRGAMPPGRPVRIAWHGAGEPLGSVRVGVETATPVRVTWTVL
jgi:hypothetical protein